MQTSHVAMSWRAADKIAYSHPVATISSARTPIERAFDSDAIRQLKRSHRDITVGGPAPRR
jgi:hypothetical protein